jgi:hypothetical protein
MTDYTLDFSEDSVGPTIDYSGSNGRIGIDDSIPAGVGATKSVSWFWRNSLDSNNTNYYFELPITLAADGVVSFYRRTSTESGFDWLRFYIDGSPPANSIWSGETAWGQSSFNLTAGAHTLRWAFTRDGSGISGSNTCWVALINVTNVVTAPPVRNSGHSSYNF